MGPERLGQVHCHEHPRLPRYPHRRPLPISAAWMSAASLATRGPCCVRHYLRLRVPGLQPVEPHLGPRERRAAADLPSRAAPPSVASARSKALAAVGLAGWESHTPAGALRGSAAAGRHRPRPGERTPPWFSRTSRRAIWILPAAGRSWSCLCELNRVRGITVVMITHEAEMAAYAGRVVRCLDGLVEQERPHGEDA